MATNQEVRDALGRMRTKLKSHLDHAFDQIVEQQAHTRISTNPHNTTKDQVALGKVENYPVVTVQELNAGDRTDRYMTPESLSVAWDIHATTLTPISTIRAPLHLTPVDGAVEISVTPTLSATSFAYDDTLSLTLGKREYQVDVTAGDFSTPIHIGESASDRPYTVPGGDLLSGQPVKWRCRDVSTDGTVGGWSTPTEFKTKEGAINPPTLGVPTIPSGVFSISVGWEGTTPSGLDSHLSTSLQIATDDQFTDIVMEVVESTTEKNTVTVATLHDQRTYYVRAKTHGSVFTTTPWSPVTEFTTGVSDAQMALYETTGDLYLMDSDHDLVGGRTTQSPPVPIIGQRDTSGGMISVFTLESITGNGAVVAVTQRDTGYTVVVQDHHNNHLLVLGLDPSLSIQWTRRFPDIIGSSVTAYRDVSVVVGHRTIDTTDEAVAVALSEIGDHVWDLGLTGDGSHICHGVCTDGASVYLVGHQTSILGSEGYTEAGFVAKVSAMTGVVEVTTSYGAVGPTRFQDAVVVGDELIAVGSVGGESAAVRFDINDDLEVIADRAWSGGSEITEIASDSTGLYLSLMTLEGSTLLALTHTLDKRWAVSTNQTVDRPGVCVGFRGVELRTTYTPTGGAYTHGAMIKLPVNGVVGSIPNAVDLQWGTPTLTGSPADGDVVLDVGDWSPHQPTSTSTFRNQNTKTPPTFNGPIPPDTETERYLSYGEWRYIGLNPKNEFRYTPWIYNANSDFWYWQEIHSGGNNVEYGVKGTHGPHIKTTATSPRYIQGFSVPEGYVQRGSFVEKVNIGYALVWRYEVRLRYTVEVEYHLYYWFVHKSTRTYVDVSLPFKSLLDLVHSNTPNPTQTETSIDVNVGNF